MMRTHIIKSAKNAILSIFRSSFTRSIRKLSSISSNPDRKISILGAAGGIGQPLTTLLKFNSLVSTLSLYDLDGAFGLAAEINHIPTSTKVVGYDTSEELEKALVGSDVVIILAGVHPKPGMTCGQLFNINAPIVKDLCVAISNYCPNALVNMVTDPVNCMVPIAAEVFKDAGTYDPKRLFGVTTLDVLRARIFYADLAGLHPEDIDVPIVGGHTTVKKYAPHGTILPLYSQVEPKAYLFHRDLQGLTRETDGGEKDVFRKKAGKGSATLSMAFAAAKFANACLKGLNGVPDVEECAFVQSDVTELPFFTSKVLLGKNGVEKIMGLGSLSDLEKRRLDALIPTLKSSIDKGIQFVTPRESVAESSSSL